MQMQMRDCNGDCLTGFTLVDGSCVAEVLCCTDGRCIMMRLKYK